MNYLKILFLLFFILITNCSEPEKKVDIIKSDDLNAQMIEAYNEGVASLDKRDAITAAQKFNQSEILFPQSIWAPRSNLMAAYSYYSQSYYLEAIDEIDRYFKTYPKDKNQSYALYLIGMCYYEMIADEKKDLQPIIKAKSYFKKLISKYPETDFSIDAKFKLDLINDILASKEMHIARYYIEKEKWIAAVKRLQFVVKNYENTIYIEEALHRLVETYYFIGLENEAKKYASLLGYNHSESDWYKKSYKIFNKEYEDPYNKIKKNKKKSPLNLLKF